MPIKKPWETFEAAAAKRIPPVTGVYELADEEGNVLYIGYAGGREPFGIRGRIERHFSREEGNAVVRGRARRYRYEVNAQYLTRHIELLTRHRDEHGRLPEGNEAPGEVLPRLGRFEAAGGAGKGGA
jgi:hypothetical protein